MEFIQLLANRLTVNRKWYGQRDCPNTHYGRQVCCFDTFVRHYSLCGSSAAGSGGCGPLHIQDFIVPYLACTARLRAVFYCLRQISAEISFKPV